jgi:hypothetical protein
MIRGRRDWKSRQVAGLGAGAKNGSRGLWTRAADPMKRKDSVSSSATNGNVLICLYLPVHAVACYRPEPLRLLGIHCDPMQNPVASQPDPYQGRDVNAKERERRQLARREDVPSVTYSAPNRQAIVVQSHFSMIYLTSDGKYESIVLTLSRPDILKSRARTASDARTS